MADVSTGDAVVAAGEGDSERDGVAVGLAETGAAGAMDAVAAFGPGDALPAITRTTNTAKARPLTIRCPLTHTAATRHHDRWCRCDARGDPGGG
jgi:hypothetical protein